MRNKQAARQRFTAGLLLAALVLTTSMIARGPIVASGALADTPDADHLVLNPESE